MIFSHRHRPGPEDIGGAVTSISICHGARSGVLNCAMSAEQLFQFYYWCSAFLCPSFAQATSLLREEDCTGLFSKFFGSGKCLIEGLIVGNVDCADAVQILNAVLDPLRCVGESESRVFHARHVPARVEMLLPRPRWSPSPYQLTILQLDGTNPEDRNSCAVESICSIAAATPENEALAALLMQIWKPMFFNELRTCQQLGYVVSSFMRTRVTHISLIFLVQTERAPEVALRSIDKFLDRSIDSLQNVSVLTEKEFLVEGSTAFSDTFRYIQILSITFCYCMFLLAGGKRARSRATF